MHLIMIDLLARLSPEWLQEYLIVFTDDVHLRYQLHPPPDHFHVLVQLLFVLTLFRSYGLQINITIGRA